MKKDVIRVTIEKLIFGGQALAREQGRVVFVWDALPGEVVDVEITKKKKDFWEGHTIAVVKASPLRINPTEEHFLCCSPWQNIDPDFEAEVKKDIVCEAFVRGAGTSLPEQKCIYESDKVLGYRNKIEFSFALDEKMQKPSLAFFVRGTKIRFPLRGCVLALPVINDVASSVLNWIHQAEIPLRSLKSLIVRANRNNEVIAGLFIKDEVFLPELLIENIHPQLKGMKIFLSDYRSPASIVDKELVTTGVEEITENLLDKSFAFGVLSFFQVNPSMFEKTLQDISKWVEEGSDVLDFYGGVGSISIPLSGRIKSCEIVDIHPEAIEYAQKNIVHNNLTNFVAHCTASENITSIIDAEKLLILDPPREGLHKNVIDHILLVLPKRVIYLSCNVSTQARDFSLLKEKYTIVDSKIYNFFPRTPHIEHLLVLERK